MKKKYIISILIILFLLLLAFVSAGCGTGQQAPKASTPTSEQKITLKLADSFPVSNYNSIHGGQYWMKRVEELTNGQVQFKHYPAEQLGKAKDLLELVRAGTTDVAYVAPAYIQGKMPLCEVATLPGLYDDVAIGANAFWKIAQGILVEQEFSKHGIRPVFVGILAPSQVMTTKKPVKEITDMKGLKLRVPGGTIEEATALTGAVPVQLPPMELYEAIQRGTVDGTLIPFASCPPYKIDELVKFSTVGANFGTFIVSYFINENVWKGLPDNVKKAMQQAGNETVEHLAKAIKDEEEKVKKQFESTGKVLYYLTPDQQKAWAQKFQPIVDNWVKRMEEKGLPGKQVLEEFKKALDNR